MKIAVVTTQGLAGSTVIGRVLPLVNKLSQNHEVSILVHGASTPASNPRLRILSAGADPFQKTSTGKKRQRGFNLLITMLANVIITTVKLVSLKPEVIIIEKSLPENVLATRLAALLIRPKKIILDVDDFELTANVTTSWVQRAAIHWAERTGAKVSHHIVAATPFLSDHFEQLTQGKKPITMIPTGLSMPAGDATGAPRRTDRSAYENRPVGVQERQDPPILVYAGSITLSSGHRIDLLPDILAEVRKEYPTIRLHVYGDGDDVEKLKTAFTEKNLTDAVIWYGRFTQIDLLGKLPPNCILIDSIDNHITNRAKSSFRVALAATLGLPVVSSDIGVRPYLLPDVFHNRCFAKPGDVKDYASKIIDFIRQPLTHAEQELLQTHGQQYTWETLGQEYEKIIAA